MTGYRAEFFVRGEPAPKGSYRAIENRHTGRATLIPSGSDADKRRLRDWTREVVRTAKAYRAENGDLRYTGPCRIDLTFWFPMSLNAAPSDRARGWCPKPTKRDKDKLERCVFDALTESGIIVDDALAYDGRTSKLWSLRTFHEHGANIVITGAEYTGGIP